MKIIDPHLHLFDLQQGQYDWLKPENPPFWPDKSIIHKSFSEKDLSLDDKTILAGFVHIEAGFDNQQPCREIEWLEEHCHKPFKSIAVIDLTLSSEQFLQAIVKLKGYRSVVGVRDILDDNALEYLSNKQVIANLQQLAKQKLIFELQMPLENVTAVELLVSFLADNPSLNIIINHAGFPPYTAFNNNEESNDTQIDQKPLSDLNWLKRLKWLKWQQAIEKLSVFEQCSIKCSGFEMINQAYQPLWQLAVINICIKYFGINRVMLASNFPLCLFTGSYLEYWQQYMQGAFSQDELNKLCFKNAEKIYKF
mgnify:CR=1 FL=1